MIASHRNVDWRGEIFHDLHESKTKVEPWGLLDGIIDESKRAVLGFETKFQHLDQNAVDLPLTEYLYRLERRKFSHFIILKRRNYLRQAISVAHGQATKTWHFRKSTPKPEFAPVMLDPQLVEVGGKYRTILDCFRFLDATYEEATQLLKSKRMLFLYYEDDFENDPMIGYKKATEFLELKPRKKPLVHTQRINQYSTRESLVNYGAIEMKLRGTEFEWMLD